MKNLRPPDRLPDPEHRGLFPTTSWTVIQSLSGGEQTFRILAWEEFCGAYWQPLFRWLCLRGVSRETAEDLVQGILVKLHESPVSVAGLHPANGKLRSFLLASLRNLWIDHIRASRSSRNDTPDEIPPDEHPSTDEPGDVEFDREWAIAILTRTVSILREEYSARGNVSLFETLLTLLDPDKASSNLQLAAKCGLTGNAFNVALKRLRERLAIRLRCEVAATLLDADDSEIDEELRHLIVVLGRGGFSSVLSGR